MLGSPMTSSVGDRAVLLAARPNHETPFATNSFAQSDMDIFKVMLCLREDILPQVFLKMLAILSSRTSRETEPRHILQRLRLGVLLRVPFRMNAPTRAASILEYLPCRRIAAACPACGCKVQCAEAR